MIKVMVSKNAYNSKPKTHEELSKVTYNFETKEVSVEELMNYNINGYAVRPAIIEGKICKENWKHQTVFCVDVDNSYGKEVLPEADRVSMECAVRICHEQGIAPAYGYYTYSNTLDVPKFRLVFVMNRVIDTEEERKKIVTYMKHILGNDCHGKTRVDSKCTDPGRYFFGTIAEKVPYENVEAVCDADKILSLCDTKEFLEKGNITVESKQHVKMRKENKSSETRDVDFNSTPNVRAIKARDVGFLAKQFSENEPLVFDTEEEMLQWLYAQNLPGFLGMEENSSSFNCIFHDDQNPSAAMYYKDGVWIYKCFAEGFALNIVQVTQKLGGFSNPYKTIKHLKKIFNIKTKIVVSKEMQAQYENIQFIRKFITNPENDMVEKLCPTVVQQVKSSKKVLMAICDIAEDIVKKSQGSNNGEMLLSASVRQIADMTATKKIETVHCWMKQLVYLGLLELVPDNEAPENVLKSLVEKKKTRYKMHISLIKIPNWNAELLQRAEEHARRWKQNGYTIKGFTYEGILRCEGPEAARRLYPQKVEEDGAMEECCSLSHDAIQRVVVTLVKQKGWTTSTEIISCAPQYGITEFQAAKQLKRSLTDIMNCYGLRKCRISKELRAKGIDIPGNGYVIIREEVR